MLDLLEKNTKLGVVQVNFDKYDKKLEKIIQKVSISVDRYCQNAETFLYNSEDRWGAIAALIIEKNAWNELDLTEALGTQTIFGYGLFEILLKRDSYIVKNALVKVRDGSEKAVKSGDGDARLTIALASGLLYRAMPSMGYSQKIVDCYLKRDRKYAYQAIPLAKLWGIKNKVLAAKKMIAIHNSPILWIKWLPLMFFSDTIYKKIHQIKKWVSSKTRPMEKRLKTYLRK